MALRASSAANIPAEEAVLPTVSPSKAAREAVLALERRGRLTPEEVVDEARDPDSPLHRYFEWDDSAAAEAWRLNQARSMIRWVHATVEYGETKLVVPNYVRDMRKKPSEQGYVSIAQCKREPATAKALLRYEFGRAAAHVNRAIDIASVIGLDGEAKAVAASIAKLLQKLE